MEKILNAVVPPRMDFPSLRGRVLLSQLPFSAIMLFLFGALAVLHPELLTSRPVLLAVLLTAVLQVLCAVVPWDRLPAGGSLAVPLLNFLPVTLLREGAGTTLTGLGLLAAFPVVWLAASGRLPRAAAPLGALLSLVMVWLPLVLRGVPLTAGVLSGPLVIPLMMLAIGLTVQVMTNGMVRQRAELEAKDAELRQLLTASRRRQRLLDGIIESVGVGVLVVGADGRVVLDNRKQRRLNRLGLPEGVAEGSEAQLLLFEEDGTTPVPVRDRPAARAARGETFFRRLVWVGAGPRQRVLSVTAQNVADEDGRREAAVLSFNDVTDLVAALEAKDDFVAGVSHELRTPLTSIRGYVELLAMDEQLPGHAREGLEVIERNAEQLAKLVDDLLGTASTAVELDRSSADLVEIVRRSVAAATPRAAAGGVSLRMRTPERLPLECDPIRLGQVLDNLLSNAVKYSPEGGPVLVTADRLDGAARIRVADRGMGMAPEDAANVFGRFYRSSGARMSAIPGLGLGLAVAAEIVEAHGGTIGCESAPGEGTVVTVTLPVSGVTGTTDDDAARPAPDPVPFP